MTAYCLIRPLPHYRHEAFIAGLKAAGHTVDTRVPIEGRPGDVLVIWNRYGVNEQIADRFEATGGTVLVAENGYIGKDKQGRQLYAIAVSKHNGGGSWPRGNEKRWEALGIEIKPWRDTAPVVIDGQPRDKHILVCGNRSFGTRGNVMPVGWEKDVRHRLSKITRREIRLRFHPGNDEPGVPLEDDLKDCHAVVIWTSSCGVAALVAGIPVVTEAKWWIAKSAAFDSIEHIDTDRVVPNWMRRDALQRLAWAQWTVEEIAAGVPFKHLCTSTAPATSTV